ncbi:hypothetical protein AXF41_13965 [Clostridium haemolyticum]|uniref:hypothetical protein n=1 Tax=Clostridium haemolyticum TaxID=84025 RepID=UPI0009CE60D1|nr:hypothetical protein [Clostridium haemolyticum]OOB74953.1 hypothetical protein AXF41_13965 [Clostridium haemolyticum]
MKSTFNDLNINQQIDFINEQLNNDSSSSVTKLCKKFGLNKNTVVSRFTKGGFKYDSSKRKYIKNDTLVVQDNDSSSSVTKLCKKFGLNKNTVVSRFTKGGFKYDSSKRKYIKNDTLVVQDNVSIKEVSLQDENTNENSINEDMEELLKYKDDIIKLVMEHKNSDEISENGMIIDNDIVGGKTTNHNFKVYTNVKNEIQELQKQYPQFRLLDLVSTALHQYCLKHLKK